MKKLYVLKFLCILLIFISAVSCVNLSFNEKADPYFIYMGDPYILYHENNYYLYGTTSEQGFLVYTSKDLKNWHGPKGAKNGFALRKEDVWGERQYWAPEVYQHNDKFYMFFTVEEHIAAAVSDSPLGPFIQTEKKLLIPEHKAIDPHLFIDDDTKYLYYVRFNNGNEIWCAELNDDLMSIKAGTELKCFKAEQTWERRGQNINEGPFMIKHNDHYYLTYSANHFASHDYGVGYAVSKSPTGPWLKHEENPILQNRGDLRGTGHHSIFTAENGQNMIVYHAHHSLDYVAPRKIFINRIVFIQDENYDYDLLEIGNIVSYAISH